MWRRRRTRTLSSRKLERKIFLKALFENIFKFLLTFEAALHGGGRVDPLLELVAGEDAVDDDEDTRHAGRDQGAHRDGPEVLE